MIKFCFSLVFSGPKFPNFLSPFPPFPSKQGTPGWKSQGLIPLPNLIARVAGRDRIADGGECKRNTMQLHQLQRGSIFHLLWLVWFYNFRNQHQQIHIKVTMMVKSKGQKVFFLLPTLPSCYVTSVMVNCHLWPPSLSPKSRRKGNNVKSEVCWTIFTITSNHFRHIPVQPRNRHHHHVEWAHCKSWPLLLAAFLFHHLLNSSALLKPNFRDHDPRITLFAPSSTPTLPPPLKD